MSGRFRELCAGVNVDAGTAAAFREQWGREVPVTAGVTRVGAPVPLLLRTDQMPGDAVAMTAAIYSLHKAHPGKYLTAVESPHYEVFQYNPDVSVDLLAAQVLHMHYPAIHRCNERGIHFMQGWCEHLENALGVRVPLLTDRPHLYFPGPTPQQEDFWLVCSGGKDDFTTKLWGTANYASVVRMLRGKVRFIQVGRAESEHPHLTDCEYMVGKTSLRQLFELVRRCRGVLCGISLLMHVAAALDKTCVVIAGGREPVQWNAYPKQHYLHTVGALFCVSTQGHEGRACWRSRVVAVGDGTHYDNDLCQRPTHPLSLTVGVGNGTCYPSAPLPECMAMIRPTMVAELIDAL